MVHFWAVENEPKKKKGKNNDRKKSVEENMILYDGTNIIAKKVRQSQKSIFSGIKAADGLDVSNKV